MPTLNINNDDIRLNSSSSDKVVVNGNLGIGTTNPTKKLVVTGASNDEWIATFTNSGTNPYGVYIDTSANSSSVFSFATYTNAGTGFFVLNNGNVGIGTTNPNAPLHVIKDLGTSVSAVARLRGSNSTARTTRLQFEDYNGTLADGLIDFVIPTAGSATGARLDIGVDSAIVSVVRGGNVGIGTTSPNAKLEVYNGTSRFWHGGTSHYTEFNNSNEINTYASNGTISEMFLNWVSGGAVNIARSAIYAQSAGNVGIGTTSPSSLLTVNGLSANTESGQIRIIKTGANEQTLHIGYNTTSDYAYLNAYKAGLGYKPISLNPDGGNVGIGTTSPVSTNLSGSLTIYKSYNGDTASVPSITAQTYYENQSSLYLFGRNSGLTIVGANGENNEIVFANASSKAYAKIGTSNGTTSAGGDMYFNTGGNAEAMRITTSGNVGINTTSPSDFLHIRTGIGWGARITYTGDNSYLRFSSNQIAAFNSSNNGTDLYFNHNAAGNILFSGTGNVGIGSTAPTVKLRVQSGGSSFTSPDNNDVAAVSIYNSNNSSTNAHAVLSLRTQISGGNPFISYDVENEAGWSSGMENSSNQFRIAYGWNSLTTYPAICITPATSPNVLIGTTTDAGIKLDVNGNGRFSGGIAYLGNFSGNPELILQATNNSWSKINFYDNNNTEGLYIRTDGESYGGTMTFGARWDDDEPKVVFKMYQSSAGAAYDVRVGVNTSSPASIMHLAGGDGQLIVQKNNYFAIHQEQAWATNLLFGSYFNGTNQVYGATGRSAFKILALHDGDVDPQYIAFYGANAGTAGNTITWNTVGFAQDEDGNVGIGTTSPTEKLELSGTGNVYARITATDASNAGVRFNASGAREYGIFSDGALRFYDFTAATERMRITSSGNVGIGTTAPDTPLSSARGIVINSGASNDVQIRMQNNGTGSAGSDGGLLSISGSQMYLWNYEASNLIFGTNNSERMRIDSSGNIGIGTTSISYRVDISGDARILSGSLGVGVAPNATDGRIDASNDIVAYSTSDQRLKENVTPIENALEKVKTLTGVEFDWKEETAHVHGYHGHDVGIIAQDVQAVLPEAVRTNDSGYLSVRYEKMIALLIEGMKEQQNQIDELKAKLNGLTR